MGGWLLTEIDFASHYYFSDRRSSLLFHRGFSSFTRPGRLPDCGWAAMRPAPAPPRAVQNLAPLPARERGAPIGIEMKPDLHPVYPPSRIVCACGNVIETRSTRGSFHVEICSNCHPFFTGKYKLVDTEGRVERFRKKYETKPAGAEAKKTKAPAKAKA